MVRIDPLPITTTIALKVKPTQNNQIFTIVRSDPAAFSSETGIIERFVLNGFIPELRAFSSVKSLGAVPIPDFSITDSDTDKLLKTQQLMWGAEAQRFELHLWVSELLNPTADDWLLEGILPLTNSAGYPYTLHNPLDLLTTNLSRQFGKNTCFGVSVKDSGWGIPTTLDTINITGCWVQDGRIIQPDYIPVPINAIGATIQAVTQVRSEITVNVAVSRRILLEPNSKRVQCSVKNNSTNATIYLSKTDTTPTATTNNGVVPPGNIFTFEAGYFGGVWAAASASGTSSTSTDIFNV